MTISLCDERLHLNFVLLIESVVVSLGVRGCIRETKSQSEQM